MIRRKRPDDLIHDIQYEILMAIEIEEMTCLQIADKIVELREQRQGVKIPSWWKYVVISGKVSAYTPNLADKGYLARRTEDVLDGEGNPIKGIVRAYYRRTDKLLPPRRKKLLKRLTQWIPQLGQA